MEFILNERLKNDHLWIKDLELSKVLLKPDSENPWVVLVPQRPNLTEFHQLNFEDQLILVKEINKISKLFELKFRPDKLNVASLGNVVSQLHIHIICRFKNDRAWPNPIWTTPSKVLEKQKLDNIQQILSDHI